MSVKSTLFTKIEDAVKEKGYRNVQEFLSIAAVEKLDRDTKK